MGKVKIPNEVVIIKLLAYGNVILGSHTANCLTNVLLMLEPKMSQNISRFMNIIFYTRLDNIEVSSYVVHRYNVTFYF